MNSQMPVKLHGVSVTVNGKNAYVYYISPTQVNVLTPPDAIQGAVAVQVTNNGPSSQAFTAQAQPLSPSFFVFNAGPYVAATHAGGEFQFNVVVPANAPSGDSAITAIYNGAEAAPAALITIQGSAPAPTSVTFYVAPGGNDFWSGTLPAPNSTNTDGPFATFDHARAFIQSINKVGLSHVNAQFRGGTYFLPATEMLTAADSGSATTKIVYQNYPGESPVFSGGVRVQNWTNAGGNTWTTTLPASTRYFENLFYNGVRRLRPRLGASSGTPLGTYYRVAATVYLNAAPPPATAPHPNCSIYVTGSGWECFDRFQYARNASCTWRRTRRSRHALCC